MHGRQLPRRLFGRFLASEWTWLAFYVLVAVVATDICVVRRCNNFLIFRAAFEHFVAGRDMYAAYPIEHADLYKYSPTFALLFAPFARLPYATSLLSWNLLNVGLIFQAIRITLPEGQRLEAIQLTGIGLVTTIDGTQSNGLVVALMVLAFGALERKRLVSAALAIAIGALIKLFPLCAAALAVPRTDRRRFALIGLGVGVSLVAMPLVFTDVHTLAMQYRSWYAMGTVDAHDRGASVMRLLHVAVGYEGPNWPVQLVGTMLLLLPLFVHRERWSDPDFRRGFLASLLVYSVIFNHKAEQPSFVIAVVGLAIWYAVSPRAPVRSVVTGSMFVATVPILIEVAAPGLLGGIDGPLLAASACCTVAWFTMQGELLDLVPERRRSLLRECDPVVQL